MRTRAIRRTVFLPAPDDEWLETEAIRLGVSVQEVVRRIVALHRERLALRGVRKLKRGDPMLVTRGGQGNRQRKGDVGADPQLPLDA